MICCHLIYLDDELPEEHREEWSEKATSSKLIQTFQVSLRVKTREGDPSASLSDHADCVNWQSPASDDRMVVGRSYRDGITGKELIRERSRSL